MEQTSNQFANGSEITEILKLILKNPHNVEARGKHNGYIKNHLKNNALVLTIDKESGAVKLTSLGHSNSELVIESNKESDVELYKTAWRLCVEYERQENERQAMLKLAIIKSSLSKTSEEAEDAKKESRIKRVK